jgi:16S rRNA (cytosine967-C5)-methyltransferase
VASPARRLAFTLLQQLVPRGPTLDDALAGPEAEALDPRERGFLHELVLGTLRRRGAIDHALAARSDRALDRLTPDVQAALRLGAHQLLHLRVPAHAAVSESVELIRQIRPRASGFVNAVLRGLTRTGPPPLPDPMVAPREWLTTGGSLPAWLADRWLARLGPGPAVARARALLEEPPAHYRLNPRVADAQARADAAGLGPRPGLVPGAWEATAGRLADLAKEAVLYPQDQASQMGTLLDACAAPGGKSTLLADQPGTARVVAADLSRRRLQTLAALVERWGARNVHVVGADGLRPPFGARFDAVLLDAPCSGLGTLARHPDIRWRLPPDELPKMAARQGQLLAQLAPLVRPGGLLVYAVCSIEPEENEEVVEPFLAAGAPFDHDPLPAWAAPFADGPYARTRPELHSGDAFFAARLRRR